MKVLMIGYYFDPYPGVGAKRLSYWADKLQETGHECNVLTATEQKESKPEIIYIPDEENGPFLSKLILDPGLKWKSALKKYFNSISVDKFDYNYVIISGGPFMHFSISKYIKSKFNAKIILDFRDPFANNPRFKDSWIKKLIKKYFERQFTKNADAVITVNSFCADLIENKNTPEFIIENGYDEEKLQKVKDSHHAQNAFVLAHAGSLYADRDPSELIKTIKEFFTGELIFWQYGPEPDSLQNLRDVPYYNYKGTYPYDQLLQELTSVDGCVLITKGDPFESTTKVFDYIALNKKILIITKGSVKTGNLHEITKKYPNVIWSKNDVDDIKNGIKALKKMTARKFDPYPFSRAASFDKLMRILNNL